MGMLDSFKKSKEEKKEQTTPPAQGHTLAQIMQDKNKSHLFGELLNKQDKNLAARLAKNTLTEADIHRLEDQRKVFSEQIIKAEKIEKLVTKENIIDIARGYSDFEKILNLVGPEKAVQVIKNRLKEMSITEEGTFNDISSAMETVESFKTGKYKELNDKVEKFCKDNNIAPKEYLAALAIEDPAEKEEALKKLATSPISRTINWRLRGKFFKESGGLNNNLLNDLQQHGTSFEDSIKELNDLQGEAGTVLFLSVSGSDTMRNNLFGELTHEKAPENPKSGFMEAKNVNTLDEAQLDKDWEKKKKATQNYARLDLAGQEAIKAKFREEQIEAGRSENESKGIWAEIFAAIRKVFIEDKELK